MTKVKKTEEKVKEPKQEVCDMCKGRGKVQSTPFAFVTCSKCQGTGVIK